MVLSQPNCILKNNETMSIKLKQQTMRDLVVLILLLGIECFASAFPTKSSFILLQQNSQNIYCQLLLLQDNGKYKYYELEFLNERFLEIKMTDSLSGIWNRENEFIYLYSNYYCDLETEEQKQIQKVLMSDHFIKDYMCLSIIDDCTLTVPNLYHQFRCIDSLISDSNGNLPLNYIGPELNRVKKRFNFAV